MGVEPTDFPLFWTEGDTITYHVSSGPWSPQVSTGSPSEYSRSRDVWSFQCFLRGLVSSTESHSTPLPYPCSLYLSVPVFLSPVL